MIESQENAPQAESREGCWLVIVLAARDGIFIVPGRRKAPFPSGERPVCIRWRLVGPDVEWAEQGIEMKDGWDPAWGEPQLDPARNEYVLTVQDGPADRQPYAYTTRIVIDRRLVEIDPEVEYDRRFA